jgi:hypothetical protein
MRSCVTDICAGRCHSSGAGDWVLAFSGMTAMAQSVPTSVSSDADERESACGSGRICFSHGGNTTGNREDLWLIGP